MSEYRYTDAIGYTLDHITAMHNSSFEGYFFPATMTARMTADFWRTNQIDATRSVIMHDEATSAFVGMARMGTRGARGWCGGFGIVPAFRGKGAGRLLAAVMVHVARESGLERLQLEVLTQNTPAIKLYERTGFRIQRRLVGIEIETEALPPAAPIQTEIATIETLLPSLTRSDVPLSWQRDLPTLLSLQLEAVVRRENTGTFSGLVVQRGGERAIIQASALPGTLSTAEVAAWLRGVAGEARSIQVYNEPEGSPFLEQCRALGFREFFSQHEMSLDL